MVGAMMESSWMMGMSDLFKSVDPSRMKQGDSDFAVKLFDRFMQTMQSIAVGNWAKQANRQYLEMTDNPIKKAQGFEKMYRDIPYVQNSLGNIISAFGEPVVPVTSEKMFFPFASGTEIDPVAKLFTDNGVFMSREQSWDVIDSDTKESYTIQDDELYDYAELRGRLVRKMTAKYLERINNAEPEKRVAMLKEIRKTAQETAKAVFDYQGEQREEKMRRVLDDPDLVMRNRPTK